MANFESAKRSFGTSEHSQKWDIPVGNVDDDLLIGIEGGELTITKYVVFISFCTVWH